MKIVVVGAGAVGGLFGGLLARSGETVSFVARGRQLEALRGRGLRVESPLGSFEVRAPASEDPAALGPADLVLVAVKTWQLKEVAPRLGPLVRPGTVVVPLENGVEAADVLSAALRDGSVVGGLCHVLAWIESPGLVRHGGPAPRATLGERWGGPSERLERIAAAFRAAGIEATVTLDVQQALWEKFLFIDPFGTAGAVSRSPIGEMRETAETRVLLVTLMREVAALAKARGVSLPADVIDRTLARLDALPFEATASMQRDLVAGRPSELFEQTGAVVRLAAAAQVPVPAHDALFACLVPQEVRARRPARP